MVEMAAKFQAAVPEELRERYRNDPAALQRDPATLQAAARMMAQDKDMASKAAEVRGLAKGGVRGSHCVDAGRGHSQQGTGQSTERGAQCWWWGGPPNTY